MSIVKTAISIDKPLFEELEALARELDVSRSKLFARAVEEFIQHHRNQEIFNKINQAYSEKPDTVEEKYLKKMKLKHRKVIKGEW